MSKVVVGLDGSDSSIEALRWAKTQARTMGASLEVVSVWEYPLVFTAPVWPPEFDPETEARTAQKEITDRELGIEPDVEFHQSVIQGHPAPVLVQAAEHADLLVVGSRGHGAFAGMMLGSVSEYCASHASCPVVVVRHLAPRLPDQCKERQSSPMTMTF